MHEYDKQHEEVEIRTGLKAGDDTGMAGSGGYTSPGGGGLGSGGAVGGGTAGSGH
jgi:hypothetical protein